MGGAYLLCALLSPQFFFSLLRRMCPTRLCFSISLTLLFIPIYLIGGATIFILIAKTQPRLPSRAKNNCIHISTQSLVFIFAWISLFFFYFHPIPLLVSISFNNYRLSCLDTISVSIRASLRKQRSDLYSIPQRYFFSRLHRQNTINLINRQFK